MLEYASIRFTFVCPSAERFPTSIVARRETAHALDENRALERLPLLGSGFDREDVDVDRRSAAKPAAFGPTEKKVATGVGEPS